MIKGYQDLEVYKRSYNLALRLHQTTLQFPSHERYELGSQIRRSAVSVPLNIAEGYGRKSSPKEFKHFIRNALGSTNEARVLVDMAKDLGYLESSAYEDFAEQYQILSKQLYRLMERWEKV
jgi:four helix bundle protein